MTVMVLARPEPFRIGRVLSESCAVIGRNFWLCCLLALIFRILPQSILSLCAWAIFVHGVPDHSVKGIAFSAVHIIGYPGLFGMLHVALAFVAIEDWRGRRPTLRGCLGIALRRLLPATGIWLLAYELLRIGGAIGSHAIEDHAIRFYVRLLPSHIPFPLLAAIFAAIPIPAFIPGLVLWARWFVAIPTLISERSGIFRSLLRSRDLTRGSRWPLAGFWLGMYAGSVLVELVSRHQILPFGITLRFLSNELDATAEPVLTAIVMAVSYIELLRIREGAGAEDLAEVFA